jgi:hypothetical protein
MSAGAILSANPGMVVGPAVPQTDYAVGPDFERFDGLTLPTDNPAGADPDRGSAPTASDYGWNLIGHAPRPGAGNTPTGDQVYTPGPIRGTVGTVQGQPLPAQAGYYRTVDTSPSGEYTPGRTHSIQHRLGVGQDNQGAAQTVTLSEISSNPPQPGDLASIIAGQA